MKKAISAILMLGLMLAFASGVSADKTKDETSRPYVVYEWTSAYAPSEVSVCSNKGAIHSGAEEQLYVVMGIKSTTQKGKALAVADGLLANFPQGLFDHFGCVRARV